MKKMMQDKLALNKETLRTLTGLNLLDVKGGGTTSTGETSNPTLSDTCGPTCHGVHC